MWLAVARRGCAPRQLQLAEFLLVTQFFAVINKLSFLMSGTFDTGYVNVTTLWDHRSGSFRRQSSLI